MHHFLRRDRDCSKTSFAKFRSCEVNAHGTVLDWVEGLVLERARIARAIAESRKFHTSKPGLRHSDSSPSANQDGWLRAADQGTVSILHNDRMAVSRFPQPRPHKRPPAKDSHDSVRAETGRKGTMQRIRRTTSLPLAANRAASGFARRRSVRQETVETILTPLASIPAARRKRSTAAAPKPT